MTLCKKYLIVVNHHDALSRIAKLQIQLNASDCCRINILHLLISIWNKFNKVGWKEPDLPGSRELAFVPAVITFLLQDHNIADIER